MRKLVVLLVIAIIAMLIFSGSVSAKAFLIEYCWGLNCRPAEVAANVDFIETLPFDGIQTNDYAGRHLMDPNFSVGNLGSRVPTNGVWTYEQCMKSFSPITKNTFKKFTHNFAKVGVRTVGLFEDWTWIIESCKNYAKACKDLGFKGIIIDNEVDNFWNFQSDSQYFVGHTLKESHLQARLRGKQVMEAMVSAFPEIDVIVFHGPYTSASVNSKIDRGIYCSDYALLGAFAAGVIEGSGLKSTVCDGGELYDFRELKEFQDSYKWRKFGITDSNLSPPVLFMDDNLRKDWSSKCSISFGLYSQERPDITKGNWRPIKDMNVVRTTTANALKVADKYVWHYTPNYDWFNNPKNKQTPEVDGYYPPIPQEWIEAIKLARKDTEVK